VKFKTTMLLTLLLSASFATAAEANYFSNPRLGIILNVGSARNPTPACRRFGGASMRWKRTGPPTAPSAKSRTIS
jgi:hypothetical protein